MNQWIFWRHAEAAWCREDHERCLTDRGRLEAQASADWLHARAVDFPVFCSEARRAQETAACYRTPTVLAGLNPEQSPSAVFSALEALGAADAVIVGHLPWIGAVVAALLEEEGGYHAVGYSEVFWLASQERECWQLKARYRG